MLAVVVHLAPSLRRREQRGGRGGPAAVRPPARLLAGLEAHEERDAEPQQGGQHGVRLFFFYVCVKKC